MTPNEILGIPPERIEEVTNCLLLRTPDIPAVVTAAIQLDRDIKQKQQLLDALKERLRMEASRPAVDQTGTFVTFTGLCGNIAKVLFPSARSIPSFWFNKTDGREIAWRYVNNKVAVIGDIKKLAGRNFKALFRPLFKPTKDFAGIVDGLVQTKSLSKKRGNQLLELCLEESTARVEFDVKPAAAAAKV